MWNNAKTPTLLIRPYNQLSGKAGNTQQQQKAMQGRAFVVTFSKCLHIWFREKARERLVPTVLIHEDILERK